MILPKSLCKAPFIIAVFIISTSTAIAQQKGEPPTVKELTIAQAALNRTELIKLVEAADCAMEFKESTVDGAVVYTGTDNYKTSLQITGKDETFSSAKWTLVFANNKPVDYLEFQRMSYFAYIMAGSRCVEFLNQQTSKFIKDPTQAFSGTMHFEGNGNGTVSYQPDEKALVLTFTDR